MQPFDERPQNVRPLDVDLSQLSPGWALFVPYFAYLVGSCRTTEERFDALIAMAESDVSTEARKRCPSPLC